MKPIVKLLKLGRLPYLKALATQQTLFNQLKQSVLTTADIKHTLAQPQQEHARPQNSLILVEHEPVYTIGIRSKDYDASYVEKLKKELADHELQAQFVETNRGGLITFHGPGQLVAYPILYLGDFSQSIKNKSVREYVNLLESTIIDTLAKVGIAGAHTVREYPGVWLGEGERKVAFIGISCKRYVTMHGISINCDCNLAWFDHIVSCGIENKIITSVKQELSSKLEDTSQRNPTISADKPPHSREEQLSNSSSVDTISSAFCLSFSDHFNCKLIV